jgi:hypothetical protein
MTARNGTIGSVRLPAPRGYSPADQSQPETAVIDTQSVTAERRRPDLADGIVVVASLLAFAALMWLGRGLTFFADEWAVMAERPISLDSFLQPFNEHWLGVMTIVYRLLLEAIGLSTYMPYLALLAVLHMVVVAEVYVLARRAAGPWLGAAIAVVVAFFGSGFENLFWAMQIGFVGAAALGLGAFILFDRQPGRGRVVAGTALSTVAMMTSGFGIFMLVLLGLDLLLDPRRRRLVLALAVPAGVYLAWYLVFGRSGVGTARDPFTLDALLSVPYFIVDGVGTAFGSALGIGPVPGRVAAIALAFVIVIQLVRGRSVPSRTLACFGAILFEYALLGLLRAQLFDGAAEYSRYAYLSGIFALLGLASLVGPISLPERGTLRLAMVAGLISIVTLALVWNVWLLRDGRDLFAERAAKTRATIVLATGDLGPGIDPDRAKLLDRTITRLREVLDEFGSPLQDSLAGDAVEPVSPALVDSVRAELAAESAGS